MIAHMPETFQIHPSVLSADFSCLKDQVAQVEAAGADGIHIDVMDGHFVPNLTMGPFIVEAFRKMTSLPLDVHLMIEHPEHLLPDFIEAGADLLYIHIENNPNLYRTLQSIQQQGRKAAVVLNPGTPTYSVEAVLPMVDAVLVMSVNPGYSGQEYLPEAVVKIAQIRRRLDEINPNAMVAVDGGITAKTLPQVLEAGAQIIIAATSVFKNPNGIAAGIQELRACFPH